VTLFRLGRKSLIQGCLRKQVVTSEEGALLAQEFDIPFFETSAIANINVEDAFMSLIHIVKRRLDADASDTALWRRNRTGGHCIDNQTQSPGWGCC
jgi:hypothetical protein